MAITPGMGWNSWNHYHCDGLNEKVVIETMDAFVEKGLKAKGYEFINLDDCWQIARNEVIF